MRTLKTARPATKRTGNRPHDLSLLSGFDNSENSPTPAATQLDLFTRSQERRDAEFAEKPQERRPKKMKTIGLGKSKPAAGSSRKPGIVAVSQAERRDMPFLRETRQTSNRGNGRSDNKPFVTSAANLRIKKFPPLRFIVEGFIVEGCTLLAGKPKLGKSWLMLDMALATSLGRYCLGNVKRDQGGVLYLALEDNERRLQKRIEKLLGASFTEWPAGCLFATEWPRANEGGIQDIQEWIKRTENPRLIVVDVLAMFRPTTGSRETLYEADYGAIKGLQALASEFHVAIVIVHHTRKSGSEADPFEKVSGTLGLSGAADTTIVLDRDGHGSTLYSRGRDIEEIEKAVTFDPKTYRWTIIGEASEVRQTDERSAILGLLKEADEPMSPSDVANALGLRQNNVKQLLFKMAKAGEVVKPFGRGKYIHPDRTDLSAALKLRNHDNLDNQVTRKRGKEPQNDQCTITATITDNQGLATRSPLNGYPVIEACGPDDAILPLDGYPVIEVTGVEGGDTAVDEWEGQI
jgi:hypothetical protein